MTTARGSDPSSTAPRLLNLGCGASFHAAWINVDTVPAAPGILRQDLARGLPYSAGSIDAIYSSHVLEHFAPLVAQNLINECARVLRPGGIARIVVPDLEAIARLYLKSMEGAIAGDAAAAKRYDWLMLELYDQTVRSASGGEMLAYLRSPMDEDQKDFVANRIGVEAMRDSPLAPVSLPKPWLMAQRLRSGLLTARRFIASSLAFLVLGREGSRALSEGIFRRSGEVHQWMYDRYSLGRMLKRAGFTGIRTCGADDSAIPGFTGYGLEAISGVARKPDSLYMEARKPDLANRSAEDA